MKPRSRRKAVKGTLIANKLLERFPREIPGKLLVRVSNRPPHRNGPGNQMYEERKESLVFNVKPQGNPDVSP